MQAFPQYGRNARSCYDPTALVSNASGSPHVEPLFPYDAWQDSVDRLAADYQRNEPFPHIHLEGFLKPAVARRVLEEFPDPTSPAWREYKHFNENKLGMTRRDLFPPAVGALIDEFNSPQFVLWLSKLTCIPGLKADPSLEGGGMHQSTRNGFLNIHADFTMHHHHRDWRRRVNLILYLNEGWQDDWGGAIELWDRSMQQCVVRVAPLFNHALIFNTDEASYHGFPDKIACPDGVTRKSLALYYYTLENSSAYARKSTNYRSRPADTYGKSTLIWLDKMAIRVYSKLKSSFGLSDDLASRILGFFSRK